MIRAFRKRQFQREPAVHEHLCAYSDLPIINRILGIFTAISRVQNSEYIKLKLQDIFTATLSSGIATVEARSLPIESTVRSLLRVSLQAKILGILLSKVEIFTTECR
jgi:hypothetical protein